MKIKIILNSIAAFFVIGFFIHIIWLWYCTGNIPERGTVCVGILVYATLFYTTWNPFTLGLCVHPSEDKSLCEKIICSSKYEAVVACKLVIYQSKIIIVLTALISKVLIDAFEVKDIFLFCSDILAILTVYSALCSMIGLRVASRLLE